MKIVNILILCAAFILVGCTKFLDIAPKSSVPESEIFESEFGFQQALVGVYALMATQDLYGDNLTMGFASVLGKNYNTSNSMNPFNAIGNFDYESSAFITRTNTVWSSSYKAIAVLNNIIYHTEKNQAVLSESAYHLIRGEALALRAYLHFDLLRLFGPSYATGANEKAIPYRKVLDHYSTVPSTTNEVVGFVLEDIQNAQVLLKKFDPILSNTRNRQIKMNYYAVKALEARVLLYKNDTDNAYQAAYEVVDSKEFPFVVTAAVAGTDVQKDRLFKSELVFTLRVRTIANWVNNTYFKFRNSATFGLTNMPSKIDELYENNHADIRRQYLFEDDQSVLFPSKYWQTNTYSDSLRLDQLVPLIRISEMYYILAETAPTLTQRLEYLNTIRKARNLTVALQPTNLTADYLRGELTKEYGKEFFAEGQLFYYYKRLQMTNLLTVVDPVPLWIYKLPVPNDELEFNPNY